MNLFSILLFFLSTSIKLFFSSSLLRNSFKRFFLSNIFLSFYLSQILSLSLLCYFCFIKIYHFPFSTYFFLLSIKTNCFSRTNKFYLLNFEGRNEKKKQKKGFSLRTKKGSLIENCLLNYMVSIKHFL